MRVVTADYPTGPRGDGSGCPQGEAWEPDCFVQRVMAARGRVPAEIPFLLTEYSVMVGEGMALLKSSAEGQGELERQAFRANEPPFQHDDAGGAAFIFRIVPQLSPHLEALSYWTFSDIFEENSIPRTEVCKRAPFLSMLFRSNHRVAFSL